MNEIYFLGAISLPILFRKWVLTFNTLWQWGILWETRWPTHNLKIKLHWQLSASGSLRSFLALTVISTVLSP